MTLMRNTLATAAVLGALAAAPYAHAADPCKLEISGNDLMQYDKPELSAPATCKQITVTLHHTGKLPREAMGHNWVLVNAADLAAVATAGMGASRDIGAPQVFGGQVLGQALSAAAATVEGRVVHSLHAYFLRRGDCNAPIVYQVDRSLDGHSFANRRVVAIQHGQQIFNMAASFQATETGFDHQIGMPAVPPPERLAHTSGPPAELLARLPERARRLFEQPRPFEFRMVQRIDYLDPQPAAPERQIWFRAVDALADDEMLHRRDRKSVV